MTMQSIQQIIRDLQDVMRRLAGQPDQWQECRQYCPIKPERPVQRRPRSSYYQ